MKRFQEPIPHQQQSQLRGQLVSTGIESKLGTSPPSPLGGIHTGIGSSFPVLKKYKCDARNPVGVKITKITAGGEFFFALFPTPNQGLI